MGFIRRRTRRRTMMVAGGLAYEAGKNRAPQEEEYAPEPAQQEVPPAPPAPAPAAAAAPAANPELDELERLAELHKSGALTDDEFTAAKARVLGTGDAPAEGA